jgi:hypothetical protein
MAAVLVAFPGRRWLFAGAAVLGPGLCAVLFGLVLFPGPLLDSPWAEREAGRPLEGDVAHLFGNEEMAAEAVSRMGDADWIVSDSYTLVHLLGFLNGGEVPTRLANVSSGSHGLASLYWHRPDEMAGCNALVVSAKREAGDRIAPLFDACESEPPIEIVRRGALVRRVHVWRCLGLREPVPAFTRLD